MSEDHEKKQNKQNLDVLEDYSNALKNNGRVVFSNPDLGKIIFDSGMPGDLSEKNKGGYGIRHLIASRFLKDGMNEREISALLIKIKDVVETVHPENPEKTKLNLIKDGIWVGISKQWNGTDETWVITGFPEKESIDTFTKEATDTIQTVIAQNSYALEHSSIREQVGAVIDSITQQRQMSIKTQGERKMPGEKKELYMTEEDAVRIQLAREIRANMPGLTDGERAAALAILEAGAASMKMTLPDYVKQTFPNGVFGDIEKAKNAAHQQGVEINGAVSISGFGANARAVIYASKTADFSTWCHELSHIWQAQLTGELKDNAEKAFQVQNGNWQGSTYTFADGHTDTSAEAFAYGFEDFLKHKAGEMATEDKKAIFEKFADYMARTYNGIGENIKISEEIAKVYEAFVQLDDNVLAEAEKAVRMEKEFVSAVALAESKPIEIIHNHLQDISNLKELRISAREEYKKLDSAVTKDGRTVQFTTAGFKELKNHSAKRMLLDVIPQLKELTENAEYLFSEKPEHFTKQDTKNFHNYGVKINYNGEDSLLRIAVRESDKGDFYYDMQNSEILAIKKGLKNSHFRGTNTASNFQDLSKDKLYQWLKFVKENDVDNRINFQLVGERSILRMVESEEKERILEDLKVAKVMEEKFKGMEEKSKAARIKSATGWEKTADGRWKYETDDSISRIKSGPLIQKMLQTSPDMLAELSKRTQLSLNDVLDAPELFKIFPFMKNVNISFYTDETAFRGLLTPNGIKVNTKYLHGVDGEKGLKGTLAHEIQHVIQAVEFAEKKGIHGEDIEHLYNDMQGAMKAVQNNHYDYDITSLQEGLDGYMHDFGEVEARNVARRITMTYNERRHTTLESTEDVARNLQFQVIGKRGASSLDEAEETKFRMENLSVAEEMEKNDRDEKIIKIATGWEKGADSKWRWEIDDSKVHFDLYSAMEEWDNEHPRYKELLKKFYESELSEEEQEEFDKWVDERNYIQDKHTDLSFAEKLYGKDFRLPEVMNHPELFKAYPELKDVTVSIKEQNSPAKGDANYKEKHINLYRAKEDTGSFEDWKKEAGSVLLHEVQHIIQGIEGFAKGADLDTFTPGIEAPELTKALSGFRTYSKERLKNFSAAKEYQQYKDLGLSDDEIKELRPNIDGLGTIEEIIERDIKDHGVDWVYDEIQSAAEVVDNEGIIKVNGKKYVNNFDAYRSAAGEVEARNVQSRMNMSQEQRQKTLLSETEDVSRDRQIVQKDEEIAASAKKDNPEWLKTPFGEPSELSEKEWYRAHTRDFKEKYGDWELKAKKDFLFGNETVSSITGEEFPKDEKLSLIDQVEQYFSSQGNEAISPFFGKVVLDKAGADDSFAHGMGRLKAAAYASVKDVIEKGVIIDSDYNHKDRGYNSYVVAAPIKIKDENYICEVVLKRNRNETKFYLHEVTEQKKFLERAFVTSLPQKAARQGTMLTLLENTFSVNDRISCPLSKNMEPKKQFMQKEMSQNSQLNQTATQGENKKTAEKTSPKVKKQRRIIIDARGERDPVKYMGKYLAAGNMLATFLTDEKTLDAMQKSVLQRLTPAMARKDYAEVYRFGNEAARSCTETCKRLQVYMKKNRQQNQEQAKVFEEISMAD